MGTIVGGIVGGVVAISLAIIAIGLFLRRRRLEVPVTATPPAVGAAQPPMDEIQQPLTIDDGYTASSIGSSILGTPMAPMRNVRVSCPISLRASMCTSTHRMRFLVHSFFFFDTQDPNYPSTFTGYQGVPQTPAAPPPGALPSLNGSGNSLATMQTSRLQGYHGFPTV